MSLWQKWLDGEVGVKELKNSDQACDFASEIAWDYVGKKKHKKASLWYMVAATQNADVYSWLASEGIVLPNDYKSDQEFDFWLNKIVKLLQK